MDPLRNPTANPTSTAQNWKIKKKRQGKIENEVRTSFRILL
jgi:hypothetical protein